MLLRLLTIRPTYCIANTLWEPRMPPVFCGMKGNGLLLIIKPQTRFDSGQMRCWLCPAATNPLHGLATLRGNLRHFSAPNFIRVSSEKVVQRETSVSEVVR